MTSHDCAILIVESEKAAYNIMRVINAHAVIFSQNPIRVLRQNDQRVYSIIINLARRYGIQAMPALITADNKVRIGNNAIISFLPQFAQSLQYIAAEDANQRIPTTESEIEEYQRSSVFNGMTMPNSSNHSNDRTQSIERSQQPTDSGQHHIMQSHARPAFDDDDDDNEDMELRMTKIKEAAQARLNAIPNRENTSSTQPQSSHQRAPAAAQQCAPACQRAKPKTQKEIEDAWERELAEEANGGIRV
jgi:hypothetical protein